MVMFPVECELGALCWTRFQTQAGESFMSQCSEGSAQVSGEL